MSLARSTGLYPGLGHVARYRCCGEGDDPWGKAPWQGVALWLVLGGWHPHSAAASRGGFTSLGCWGQGVTLVVPDHGAGPAGVFLPLASIVGNHGNRWRCSAHAEGGQAAPRGSPSILPPAPTAGRGPRRCCRVRVAGIGRRGSRGERRLPWPCRNTPAQRGQEPPRAPVRDLSGILWLEAAPSAHGGGSSAPAEPPA